jgi:hypothetical protein
VRHFPGEHDREQDCTADGHSLGALVFRLPLALHSRLAAHEVPPLVLGAAEVEFDVVVVVPVVVVVEVEVVSVLPGAVADCTCWGTRALIVSVTWTIAPDTGTLICFGGCVVQVEAWLFGRQNSTSLTSKRRPCACRWPCSTRTRFRCAEGRRSCCRSCP